LGVSSQIKQWMQAPALFVQTAGDIGQRGNDRPVLLRS